MFLTLDDRIRALTAANLRLIFDKTYWWPKVVDGLYRPVTTLSLLFNYTVLGNGQNATGYHVVNFLLHAGNAWAGVCPGAARAPGCAGRFPGRGTVGRAPDRHRGCHQHRRPR